MSKQEELRNIVATLLNKDSEHFELLESSFNYAFGANPKINVGTQ